MKEDLHQLIDGDLPDDDMAEYLHRLSVDPEGRQIFRQQLKLQYALHRNDLDGGLSVAEDAEMLGRLTSAVGDGGEFARRWLNIGSIALLFIGLLLGTGAGYMLRGSVDPAPPTTAEAPARTEQTAIQPPPQMQAPAVVPFNRDSVVAAIRDSLLSEVNKPAVTSSSRAAASKRTTSSSRVRPSTGGSNDLTGAPEAAAKRKRGSTKRR